MDHSVVRVLYASDGHESDCHQPSLYTVSVWDTITSKTSACCIACAKMSTCPARFWLAEEIVLIVSLAM